LTTTRPVNGALTKERTMEFDNMHFYESDDNSGGDHGGGSVDLVDAFVRCRNNGTWYGTIEMRRGDYVGEEGADFVPKEALASKSLVPDELWESLMEALNCSGWPSDVRGRALRCLRRVYRQMSDAGVETDY
jgi:hypothetical protein